MAEFAMHVVDRVKHKAGTIGAKRNSVRLEGGIGEEEEDGLPFPSAPDRGRGLTLTQMAGLLLATILLAGVFAFLLLGDSRSESQPASTKTGSGVVGGKGEPEMGGRPTPSGTTPAEPPAQPPAPPPAQRPVSLQDVLDAARIRGHLESLYSIAMSNGGNRVMGSNGYNASVEYVLSTLSTMAGLTVEVQNFVTTRNKMDANTPASLSIPALPNALAVDVDFSTMANTGFGNLTGVLVPAGFAASGAPAGLITGCNSNGTSDFGAVAAAVASGRSVVALVERGDCFFADKMENARAAGAAAVLIYNAGDGAVFAGTLGSSGDVARFLPSFGLSSITGRALADLYRQCTWRVSGFFTSQGTECAPVSVGVAVAGQFESITSQNIITETKTGDASSVIVIGAHLDSVEKGPGINDNGSGTLDMPDKDASSILLTWA